MSGGEGATIEFSVNLTCSGCVRKTEGALSGRRGISSFKVDLDRQSVVVETSLPTAEVQKMIESTGKSAVVVGVGKSRATGSGAAHLGAAVAALGGALGAGAEGVRGVVRFVQLDGDTCLVDGTIDGLAPGAEHGLAVHESGDLSGGCASVGGHFNPRGVRHGSPASGGDGERHVGDLGNVRADAAGKATFRFSNDLLKVWDVVGRSLVVSQDRDDLGEGGHPRSMARGYESLLFFFMDEWGQP